MSTDDLLEALHQQGFVLMPGVLDAGQIADLCWPIDAGVLGDHQEAEYD
nr:MULTISPECIES: hypothetical protein [unclassified Pseudomonas]